MTVSSRLTISNELFEVSRIRYFVESHRASAGLAKETVDRVILATEELVTNVIEHGYTDGCRHEIEIALSISEGEILVTIEDDGDPFNPLNAPAPHLDAEIDRRPDRGLGIHLVRNMAESMDYHRRSGRNRITIRVALGRRAFPRP